MLILTCEVKKGDDDMIDTQKLKGLIAERGTSQRQVAFAIGITEKTFYKKMKIGVFGSDEIDKMINFLDISDPVPIFFKQCLTPKDKNNSKS